MSKNASLKQCERLMDAGKQFTPILAQKAHAAAAGQKDRYERWEKVKEYIRVTVVGSERSHE